MNYNDSNIDKAINYGFRIIVIIIAIGFFMSLNNC